MNEFFSYLFSPTQPSVFNYATHLLIAGGVLILIGVLFKLVEVYLAKKKKNKAFKRTFRSFPGQMIWSGILLIILVESRLNNIAYLSMRFLLFLLIAFIIYYFIKVIYNAIKVYPGMKKITSNTPKKDEDNKHTYTTSKK